MRMCLSNPKKRLKIIKTQSSSYVSMDLIQMQLRKTMYIMYHLL